MLFQTSGHKGSLVAVSIGANCASGFINTTIPYLRVHMPRSSGRAEHQYFPTKILNTRNKEDWVPMAIVCRAQRDFGQSGVAI